MDSENLSRRVTRVRVAREAESLLRADLQAGRWADGERLPSETALAAELGVGRSSVREAVQSLARDGLLVVRHGIGTLAQPGGRGSTGLTVTDMLRRARILEVYEVRRGLEVEAARLAAARAATDPRSLQDLCAILQERQRLVGCDTVTFVDADLKFHRAVVTLAGNTLLSDLFDQFYEPLRDAITALVDHEPRLPDTSKDHADLLDALRAGDSARAAEATIAHFEVVISLLRQD